MVDGGLSHQRHLVVAVGAANTVTKKQAQGDTSLSLGATTSSSSIFFVCTQFNYFSYIVSFFFNRLFFLYFILLLLHLFLLLFGFLFKLSVLLFLCPPTSWTCSRLYKSLLSAFFSLILALTIALFSE